jgi:hypothetical protein
MNESKLKKVIVAVTVGAVALMFFLVSFLVYQLVFINSEKRKGEELTEKIAEYNALIEQGEDTLETRSMRWWIERRAREIGYTYEDDLPLN